MNCICTWLCADEKGEESLFPQTGRLSSSAAHQHIYWRCLLVFFTTSRRFNKEEKHILFTNVHTLPVVDGIDVGGLLKELDVEVVTTGFRYKTPKGYYGAFQNQFYEFSILEHIANSRSDDKDQYLILDSDCIFLKPVAGLFAAAAPSGFISFQDDVLPDYVINGLSRNDLRSLYTELLEREIDEIPAYHLGEFLLCSVAVIRQLYADFTVLWPELLKRHAQGRKKFNEEAHTLSYLYFCQDLRPAATNTWMKRIWTNPLFYRNAADSDVDLAIWHLPAEKTFGIYELYEQLVQRLPQSGGGITDEEYTAMAQQSLGVPHLSLRRKINYYTVSYYRAIKKRCRRLPIFSSLISND